MRTIFLMVLFKSNHQDLFLIHLIIHPFITLTIGTFHLDIKNIKTLLLIKTNMKTT